MAAPPAVQNVIVEIPRPHVALARFNRAAQLNAFNLALHMDMKAIYDWFATNDDLRVLVLTGEGRAFCAGSDLVERATKPDDAAKKDLDPNGYASIVMRDLNKPIIAAVNGIAFGGGMEICMACDIIVASDKATFGLPEAKVGLFASGGGTANLHRLIGYHNSMKMLLTGDPVTAQEAYRLNLIQDVVPHAELIPRVLDLASRIASNSPDSLRASKAHARYGREVGHTASQTGQRALPETEALFRGPNSKEGPKAFAAKRKPVWGPAEPLAGTSRM
ncbi:putative carnitinyl-CoA dehydratase [Hyaloraphidium curvatum]|nr:putative carnitinyl-CoA dehydratase [Hyaloraphidium curvatum]